FACRYEISPLELHQPNYNVRNLDAGIVDVILYADLIARFVTVRTQKPLKGVAENCVPQVTDMRSLVRVDARVLNQLEPRTADIRMLVVSNVANGNGSVQMNVRVTRSSDFYRCHFSKLLRIQLHSKFGCDCTRRLSHALRKP